MLQLAKVNVFKIALAIFSDLGETSPLLDFLQHSSIFENILKNEKE